MGKKYILFCDYDVEELFLESTEINNIASYIEDNNSSCKLFMWIDGESKIEELLSISNAYMTYVFINEDEYNIISEII